MKRKDLRLLVENWRHVISEAMTADAEFVIDDWNNFGEAVDQWRSKVESGGLTPHTSTGSGVRNKIYSKIWNTFWSSYSGNDQILLGSTTENCADQFFDVLKEVYRNGANRNLFKKAFRSLGGSNKPKTSAIVIAMLFDDFMHNMRGGVEGYCWETEEEGQAIFEKFQQIYMQLISSGFGPDGECNFLA